MGPNIGVYRVQYGTAREGPRARARGDGDGAHTRARGDGAHARTGTTPTGASGASGARAGGAWVNEGAMRGKCVDVGGRWTLRRDGRVGRRARAPRDRGGRSRGRWMCAISDAREETTDGDVDDGVPMIGSNASEAASRAVEDATDGERDASTSTSESKRASRSGMGWIGLDVDKALSTFAKGGNKGATGVVGKPTLPTFERREEKTRGIKAAKPKVKDAEKLKLEWGDTLSWDSTRVDGTALNGERAPSPDVFDAILGVIDVEEMENLERQQRAKRIAKQLERRRRKREQDEEKRKRKALEQARAQARRKGDVFRSIDFEDEQETIDSEDESKPFIAVVKETVDSLMQSDVAKWTFNFIVIPSLISRIVAFTVIAPIVGEELKLQGQDRTTIELREDQESEILAKLDRFKQRMDYEVVMGRQAPLPAVEVERRIRAEAQRLEDEAISQYVSVDGNRYADLVFFAAFLIMIVAYNDQARLVVTGTKNAFFGLEPAQQAFLLLLSSDVLVGYHSADAWQTLLRAIGGHYGFAEDENLISLFVAFVPVSVDVAFKFWVFKYLRRLAPSTQVILDDIDRH